LNLRKGTRGTRPAARLEELLRLPHTDQELRVLLLRLRSLGDTVLMTPVVSTIKRVPDSKLAVAVESPFHEVLLHNPNVDRLFLLERGKHKFRERLRMVRQFREFRPHLVIDLHGGSTSAWMALFSGASLRVGYADKAHSYLYNLKVPDSREIWGRPELHTVEHQLAPLKYLGFNVEPLAPLEIRISPEEEAAARALVTQAGIAGSFALLHPAAAFDTKQWDAGRFAETARQITSLGIQTLITAGPGQEQLLEAMRAAGAGSARFLAPQSLRLFAAVTSLCDLYIGNDTGATHIAAALGKRIVVIFGSSDWKVWRPWNVEHQLVRHDLPCAPCPGYTCLHYPEPLCIRSVSIESVVEAVRMTYGTL
jgi:ADP-heptose:LPS heptosyltransferase